MENTWKLQVLILILQGLQIWTPSKRVLPSYKDPRFIGLPLTIQAQYIYYDSKLLAPFVYFSYPNPKYLFGIGIGFEFWQQRIMDLVCIPSPTTYMWNIKWQICAGMGLNDFTLKKNKWKLEY